MAGTYPVDGSLSMQDLAATLTSKEQLEFLQLTGLTTDPTQMRNQATFINQNNQLGQLAIVAKGAPSQGARILSATAYVSGAKAEVDVYRLPTS